MFSSLRTGALSARASTLVKSIGPSVVSDPAATDNSSSSSMSATRLSKLSSEAA